jgi:anti-anti-sigma factor
MITGELSALERATRGLPHFTARASRLPVEAGGLVIRLEGYLDGDAANTMMPVVLSLISRWDGAPSVVFDARELEYISSLGIGVLTMARTVARQRGMTFSLCNPRPAVLRVLELLGVTNYLSIQNQS